MSDPSDPIDEVKVRAVIALGDELSGIDPSDARYPVVLGRLDGLWRSLSTAEQDAVDRVLGRRGRPKRTTRESE